MSANQEIKGAVQSPLPAKESPESLELRAQPRPGRGQANPRMLAVLAGGLASAVLGAMLWSLQPQQRRQNTEPSELYNIDRIARSEGLSSCPQTTHSYPSRRHPKYRNLDRHCLVI